MTNNNTDMNNVIISNEEIKRSLLEREINNVSMKIAGAIVDEAQRSRNKTITKDQISDFVQKVQATLNQDGVKQYRSEVLEKIFSFCDGEGRRNDGIFYSLSVDLLKADPKLKNALVMELAEYMNPVTKVKLLGYLASVMYSRLDEDDTRCVEYLVHEKFGIAKSIYDLRNQSTETVSEMIGLLKDVVSRHVPPFNEKYFLSQICLNSDLPDGFPQGKGLVGVFPFVQRGNFISSVMKEFISQLGPMMDKDDIQELGNALLIYHGDGCAKKVSRPFTPCLCLSTIQEIFQLGYKPNKGLYKESLRRCCRGALFGKEEESRQEMRDSLKFLTDWGKQHHYPDLSSIKLVDTYSLNYGSYPSGMEYDNAFNGEYEAIPPYMKLMTEIGLYSGTNESLGNASSLLCFLDCVDNAIGHDPIKQNDPQIRKCIKEANRILKPYESWDKLPDGQLMRIGHHDMQAKEAVEREGKGSNTKATP